MRNASNEIHRPWDGEKLYFKGDDYFKDVLSAIRRAKRSVDFEVYIYEKGILGDKVAQALRGAARRGVGVRLLVDGIGSPNCAAEYGQGFKKAGVRFRVYRRFPRMLSLFSKFFGSLFQGRLAARWRGFWSRMNRRNHRKLVLVDGNRVWLGGFNVSDEHLESAVGKKAWRDTGLGLAGLKERAFRLAFNTAWVDKTHRDLWRLSRKKLISWLSRKASPEAVQINATHKIRSKFHRNLLSRLRSTHKRIWVITPYFVPTLPVLRALLQACLQGRDVRLILPEKSDIPFVRWASMTFFPALLRAGCRIYEYHKSVLHAKSLMVDDWALVGSSNLNHRSYLFDLEVDVVLQKPGSLEFLDRQYILDFKRSREITLADMENRPAWIRVLTWIFFRMRHWI